MQEVRITYIVNGSVVNKTFVGNVESVQILPDGRGLIIFGDDARSQMAEKMESFIVSQCQEISRMWVEE